MTSCVHSLAVGKIIGLAYAPPHQAEPGKDITICVEGGRSVIARVVPLPFYDPNNERQKS